MIAMSLNVIAAITGGTVHGDGSVVVTGPAFVDSRLPEPGGLYVAIVGERVDGHVFAPAAVEAGAVAVLGTRPTEAPTVVVDEPQAALARLAHGVLERLPARVVAVTGSQGKTGTKDLLAQVLREAGTVVATRGSANNELGLPLTVLRAAPETDFLVLEMGARGIGHLRYLCEIARPDVALVLNVGLAHLGEFGSTEAIARAKGELVEALSAEGTAVLNADDPLVAAMTSRTSARTVTFGNADTADVRLSNLSRDELDRPSFDLGASGASTHVRMRLIGAHQAANAAAAAAVALVLGMRLETVGTALSEAVNASRWRMELSERADGVTVINDAYNANPASMRAALETLAEIGHGRPGRTIAVLGEMRELGASSRAEHEEVGRLAVHLAIDRLLVVGEPARPLHREAVRDRSWRGRSVQVPDHEAALTWLRGHLAPGDVVLVKASRAAGLERVAQAVLDDGLGNQDKESSR
ncbi:MAG: UDP-N-acetylmuramoyl-tripeptide--D-alanyl-D-alanine ligase [Nocardioidaceae bacterium]